MRVVAGQWRGRRLQAPPGDRVRPTTDRAKEALFNLVGPAVTGAVVLDLCCGAGGLGIEALSRGAAQVCFVDRAAGALAATRANLTLCGAAPETFRIEAAEALAWLERWPGPAGRPWLLLCDPPYPSGLAAAMIARVTAGGLPPRFAGAVVEYGPHTPGLTALPAGWDSRRYGECHLAVYRPGAVTPQQEASP